MKSEIDLLMDENNIDALLVIGNLDHNPAMMYFTGGGHVTNADLIKKRGEPPVLFCQAMERDEAAKTGLRTITFAEFKWKELVTQAGGDLAEARAHSYAKQFQRLGITRGRIAIYGMFDIGQVLAVHEVDQPVFVVDPSGPRPGKQVPQPLRFADSRGWVAQ